MVCHNILRESTAYQKRARLRCPIKMTPGCHPLASVDVFVDGKKQIITLVCSVCDQTISTIRIKGKKIPSKHLRVL
jgi:transcription elongation factor Elf1